MASEDASKKSDIVAVSEYGICGLRTTSKTGLTKNPNYELKADGEW